jgi:valyl-tRNA synthetase
METGFDIIFFWVARMIFFGLHFMKEVPFKTVFLHAMVRDKHGEKMSKTKGNVVDPLHLIHGARPAEIPEDERAPYRMLFEDFPEGVAPQGADALRLTLAVYAAQGRDVRLDVKRVEGYRAFLNKLWNASKFSLMHLRPAEGAGWEPKPLDVGSQRLSPADRWILGRLQAVTQEVQAALDGFQLNEAAQALYRFVWNELCDWYIELSKPVLYGGAEAAELDGDQDAARTTLAHVLEQTLRLLHPITPYVTEEIWQVLPKAGAQPASLCVAAWPQVREEHRFAQETADMELAIALISQLRTIRSETGVKPSAQIPVLWLLSDDPAARAQLENVRAYLRALGRVERVELHPATGTERPAQSATARVSGVELYIPLAGLINLDEETKRLQKAIEKLHKDVAHVQGKLGNEKFVQNAPAELLEKERAKLDEFLARKAALERSLEELRG